MDKKTVSTVCSGSMMRLTGMQLDSFGSHLHSLISVASPRVSAGMWKTQSLCQSHKSVLSLPLLRGKGKLSSVNAPLQGWGREQSIFFLLPTKNARKDKNKQQ